MTTEEIIQHIEEEIKHHQRECYLSNYKWAGDWQHNRERANELEELLQWIRDG